jgi:hypothetical protein
MRRFVPRLEALEDRRVLDASFSVADGVLTVTGDSKANVVEITDDNGVLTVIVDGETVPETELEGVTDVVLKLGNGNDDVTYTLTGDLAADTARSIEVNLGNGKDTFTGTLNGAIGDGTSLDLTVNGQNGKDEIGITFGGTLAGALNVSASGGNGKDIVSVDLTVDAPETLPTEPIGTLTAEVLGGNGKDDLTLLVTDNSGDDSDELTEDESTLESVTAEVVGGNGKDTIEASDLVEVTAGKAK